MQVGSGRLLSSTHHRRDAARIAVEKMKAPAALSLVLESSLRLPRRRRERGRGQAWTDFVGWACFRADGD